jgi:hypothetical protein
MLGGWRYTPQLLTFTQNGKWSSFTPRLLYYRFPLTRRLGGPQSRLGHCGVEKNHLQLPKIEPQQFNQQLVVILTELSRLLHVNVSKRKKYKINEENPHAILNYSVSYRTILVRYSLMRP